MPKTFTGPDGQDYDFPDEMSEDQIKSVFRQKFGGPTTTPADYEARDAVAARPSVPGFKAPKMEESAFGEPSDGVTIGGMKLKQPSLTDVASPEIGALKGVGQSAWGASEAINKGARWLANKAGLGAQADKYLPEMPDAPKALEPHGIGENVGNVIENVAEFAAPEGKILEGFDAAAKLPKIGKLVSKLAKPLTHGAIAGAQEYVKSGGDADKALTSGVSTAAFSPVVSKVGDVISGVANKALNNVLNVSAKEFRYGRNPIEGVIREGITANSMPELEQKLSNSLTTRGQQIEHYLQQFSHNKIDATNLINDPINRAQNLAMADGNDALFQRLESLRRGLTQVHGVTAPVGRLQTSQLSTVGMPQKVLTDFEPAQLHKVKTAIGKQTRWYGTDAVENVLNDVKKEIYGNLNEAINNAAPGVRDLQNHWGELLSAHKGVQKEIANRAAGKLNASAIVRHSVAPAAGAIVGGISGGREHYGRDAAIGAAAGAAAENPAIVTRLAQASRTKLPGLAARYFGGKGIANTINAATSNADKASHKQQKSR